MDLTIRLLGGFSVARDGADVPADAWSRRSAADLVKLLALAEGHRLHREQVIDALWPDLDPVAAAPRLHKAAHYARRALGQGSLALRHDVVRLVPDGSVHVDAADLRRAGEAALAAGSCAEAEAALELYAGPLLPEDVYAPWTDDWRGAVAALHRRLLRAASRWEELLAVDPADEDAHLALAREYAERGELHRAQRQLERLEQALRRELGTAPSAQTRRLEAELAAREPRPEPGPGPQRLVGRRPVADRLREHLDRADAGRGSTVLLTGGAGIGKSSTLDLAASQARRRGWRVARGAASAIEGGWPYAPVLEAFAGLAREHPALLDGLDDGYHQELDRALAGEPVAWTGEVAHQRLFVAAAELFRLAAAEHGLLLVVDDLHEADEASVRLLHYLARCAVGERAVLLLAARPDPVGVLGRLRDSLATRGLGTTVELPPLTEAAVRRLLSSTHPDLDEGRTEEIWRLTGGVPYRVLEAARGAASGARDLSVAGLSPEAMAVLRRVALLGTTFTTDELVAAAGVEEAAAYRALEEGLAAAAVQPAEAGHRFRHELVRDELLATLPPSERARAGREVAEELARLGAPPGRVAHLFLAAGHPGRALPHARLAIDTAGALGAYRDGLVLLDAVVDHAPGPERGHLLARRGDLLMAMADAEAVEAYRAALPVTAGTEQRLVRARLARAACFQGDFDTARAAVTGLSPAGDEADAPLLLAQGMLAWLTGDVDGAGAAADRARHLLRADDPWQIVDLVALQGLVAHQRGEWFDRFRSELRRTRTDPGLATSVFDAHLCVAEYLLYGPVPYAELIGNAEGLRRQARRHGALRGVAFATALIGEASLLSGDLDTAERELEEAVDLHREIDAPAGESHSLQRLAEVRLARGDRSGALVLLQRALRLARWSVSGMHLLQRIYGTMITAASDPVRAVAVVEQAESAMGETDRCLFCDVMFAVPAAVAHADAGDLVAAEGYLAAAETSVTRWRGSAWDAALAEVRAHLARARGDEEAAAGWAATAAQQFDLAGQPLDAARCRAFSTTPVGDQWLPAATS